MHRLLGCLAFLPVLAACGGEVVDGAPTQASDVGRGSTTAPSGGPNTNAGGAPATPTGTPAVPGGSLGFVPTNIGDSVVQAFCADGAAQPLGAFTADPAFHLEAATGVRAVVGSVSPADGTPWLLVSLQFPLLDERGTDAAHGKYLYQQVVKYDLGLPDATYPVKAGSFADDGLSPYTTDSLCFADSKGGWGTGEATIHDFRRVKVTITTSTASLIEGSIEVTGADGASGRLDFHAPVGPDPMLPPVGQICCLDQSPTPSVDTHVQPGTDAVCAAAPPAPTGTFTADPFFGLAGATGMNAVIQDIGGAKDFYLNFHHPVAKETDRHGSYTKDTYTQAFTSMPTSAIPSALSFQVQDTGDSCYVDGLESSTGGTNTRSWNGQLTITSQTPTRLAGFYEVKDGAVTRRLDFDAPLQTAPTFVPYFRCCPR